MLRREYLRKNERGRLRFILLEILRGEAKPGGSAPLRGPAEARGRRSETTATPLCFRRRGDDIRPSPEGCRLPDLPAPFDAWFARRGWALHPHQAADAGAGGRAGAAADRADRRRQDAGRASCRRWPSWPRDPRPGLHTLYVSPLKALAADIRRNLRAPIEEMGLPIRVEDRTGDTPASRKKAQRADPPHILLTTPESLALLLTYDEAPRMFAGLAAVVVDEIHALAESKRGDQLMLALARLQALAPGLRRVGLSATVEDPAGAGAAAWPATPTPARSSSPIPAPIPTSPCSRPQAPPPWYGGGGTYAIAGGAGRRCARHRTTLIFHNTRAQAEIFFHALWLANDEDLPIGIHHGSLAREQRERVEAAMQAGRAEGDRLHRHAGSGHRLGRCRSGDPGRRAEERQAAGAADRPRQPPLQRAVEGADRAREPLRGDRMRRGAAGGAGACAGRRRRAGRGRATCSASISCRPPAPGRSTPTRCSPRSGALGAYAGASPRRLRRLPRFRAPPAATRCAPTTAGSGWCGRDGLWQLRDPRAARRIRMNLGTIIDYDTVKVRMRGQGDAAGRDRGGFRRHPDRRATPS